MTRRNRILIASVAWLLSGIASAFAQGAGDPLTLQGMHQWVVNDVRARGMGGTMVASGNSANALFVNPAALTHVSAIDVRFSGSFFNTVQRQSQEWVPNRLYAGLSILMEDKWAGIKDPLVFNPLDSTYAPPTSPFEQRQKPFDTFGPNWSRSTTDALPLSAALAVPFELMEMPFVAAVGGGQAIDLSHYFQNNNVLAPMLGSYRPSPLPLVKQPDTLQVQWYQHTRQRDGSIYTITPAIAFKYDNLSVGLSANIYFGSSDDLERRWDRGTLTFIYNAFKVDSILYANTWAGTSDYSGASGTVGILWEEERYKVGATLALPLTITRSYERTFTIDTASSSVSVTQSGEEKLKLPLRYSLGLVLTPTDRWTISVDYAMSGFKSSEQVNADGTVSTAWVGGNDLRLGAEYLAASWIALRGGYRQEVQPFAVAGSAIINEAVKASVTSLGFGLNVWDVMVDLAYEYYSLDYQDTWQSNINSNLTEQHRAVIGIGYQF